MLFYDSTHAPNARKVRIFLAEKHITVPMVPVDILAGENRAAPYLAKNPLGGVPILELDDGSVLSESLTICEYFEELHPAPTLFGDTPEERAQTRMWERRVELELIKPMLGAFRHSNAMFAERIRQIPEVVQPFRADARDRAVWIDQHLAERPFLCGDRFTMADITLYCGIDFGSKVGEGYDPSLVHLSRFHEAVGARESAKA